MSFARADTSPPFLDQDAVDEQLLILRRMAGLEALLSTLAPGASASGLEYESLTAVLGEASALSEERIRPGQTRSQKQGCRLVNGQVITPEGYRKAYRAVAEAGWCGGSFRVDDGGRGLARLLTCAVEETLYGADPALGLCLALNQGAASLLEIAGAVWQKDAFIKPLLEGRWTGAFALAEPESGSDLGAVTCQAQPEGHNYRITGEKRLVFWGDHDLAETVILFVLARTPDAPPGEDGLSLFICPKHVPNTDGSLGPLNQVHTMGLDAMSALPAAPVCRLRFGDRETGDDPNQPLGTLGYLMGEKGQGLALLALLAQSVPLIMANHSLGLITRTLKAARALPHHGTPPQANLMLWTIETLALSARGLTYHAAAQGDAARFFTDTSARRQAQERARLLSPLAKTWADHVAKECAILALQAHGADGALRSHAFAQDLLDAQAAGLPLSGHGPFSFAPTSLGLSQNSQAAQSLIEEMKALTGYLAGAYDEDVAAMARPLGQAFDALTEAFIWASRQPMEAEDAFSPHGDAPQLYSQIFGLCLGGWLLAGAALAQAEEGSGEEDRHFILLARFYAERWAPQTIGLVRALTSQADQITQR